MHLSIVSCYGPGSGSSFATGEEIEAPRGDRERGCDPLAAILLRSGIGIDDGLPVGSNLKEHAATPGFELPLPGTRDDVRGSAAVQFGASLHLGARRRGTERHADLVVPRSGAHDDDLAGGRLIGAVMRVFSHGVVRLRSADPTDDPVVEFRMLTDERDLVRLRDCVHRMTEIVRHPAAVAVIEDVTALSTPLRRARHRRRDRRVVVRERDGLRARGRHLPHGSTR